MLTDEEAAQKIQTIWRSFANVRRQDARVTRQLLSLVGERVGSYEYLQEMLQTGHIIVRAYGGSHAGFKQ